MQRTGDGGNQADQTRTHARAAPRPSIRRIVAIVGAILLSALHGVSGASANPADLGDAEVVASYYQNILFREPTAGEVAYWTGELRSGTDASALVALLVDSEEFASAVAPVVRLYQAHLDRVPDPGGLAFWVDQFRSGRGLADISEEFARSPEFVTLYGSLDDDRYVERVYQNVLGRNAEASGKTYWLGRLDARTSRGTVMALFSESIEFRGQTATRVKASMLYVGLLGRQPDAVGIDYWTGQIKGGLPFRDAAEVFEDLDEFQARMQSEFPGKHPLTGQRSVSGDVGPAVALKIDNTEQARPQVGINQADVVYEELVEGNLTRFIAVFHSDVPSEVGPIRSIRTGDFDVLAQLNLPLLGASGGNAGVLAQLETEPVVNVNALVGTGAYFRAEDRFAPHNLMVAPSVLLDAAGHKGGAAPALFSYRSFGDRLPAGATTVTVVAIDYGRTRASYEWSPGLRGWVRNQNGTIHVDSRGHAVAPDNVVVQVTEYGVSAADAESPEAVTVGQGEVLVFTRGVMITGTWSRSSATDVITLTDRFGVPIVLTPGTTWVSLAPPRSVTVSN